jgi:hypothetical protein
MRYRRLRDGEPQVLLATTEAIQHRVKCCDCGLVHDFTYDLRRIRGGTVVFSAVRNQRATRFARRRHGV